jgi:uroporphyrin-III C-methyltransferase / precorrin-2 dehydrogenase / sirohydrochlorin ferrochelatase
VTGGVLLAVAHGSRDPAAQRVIRALAGRAGELLPGAEVRTAFVQHARPSLGEALAAAGQPDAGQPRAGQPRAGQPCAVEPRTVVVPLLLSAGYHLSQDIGTAAARDGVPVAAPLGPDPGLVPALAARLGEAGVPPGTPVVLAAAGSADPRSAADARVQAALLSAHLAAPVLAAFASAARPAVGEAVAALTARTGGPVAVASYLLAPGVFHDRLRACGAAWVSAPLGDHPAVAGLVAARFRTAMASASARAAGPAAGTPAPAAATIMTFESP